MKKYLFSIAALIFFFSCKPHIPLPAAQKGNADFTKIVAVGDDYLSGFTNGALRADGQEASIPNLIALQCKTYFQTADFAQPLMPNTFGFGAELNDMGNGTNFWTPFSLQYHQDCLDSIIIFPVRNSLDATNPLLIQAQTGIFNSGGFSNFAVPMMKATDMFSSAFSNPDLILGGNPYYNRFAANPGQSNIANESKKQNATFFILHVGMEDIYHYARSGATVGNIQPSAAFSISLEKIIDSLSANGAKGVIANIPSLESMPYFSFINSQSCVLDASQASQINGIFQGQIVFQAGANGFSIYDPNALWGFRHMKPEEKLLLNVNPDSLKCFASGTIYPLRDKFILDSTELVFINEMIAEYNDVIANAASLHGLALVDLHSYFNKVQTGFISEGRNVNSIFVEGNFFSLDGYHPTKFGYALLTNEFIKAINTTFNSTIPTVETANVETIIFP